MLQRGSTGDSILAFDRAIALCEESGASYYLNSSLLFRAEAYFKKTLYAAALADLLRLPPAYQTYVPDVGMRSKEQITAEASVALQKQEKSRFRMK